MAKKNVKAKKAPVKKELSSPVSKVSVDSSAETLKRIEERLSNLESKIEVLNGVTREYLESQFAKLDEFHKERQQIVKIIDLHESRINSLEGF